jgi:hypothetical protein
MNDILKKCLDDLEDRIDLPEEAALLQEWKNFASGQFTGGFFSPKRSRLKLAGVNWPKISVNAALNDFDLMALSQYGYCSEQLARADGSLLNVRCNYGTSIIPLLFGAEAFIMDEASNTLPGSRPVADQSAIRKIIAAGIPDLKAGFGERVFEMGDYFAKISHQYPKIGRTVSAFHPDLQGPIDICELLWGSAIFTAIYDEPDLVHELLALVVETYIAFMRAWEKIIPFDPEFNSHWSMLFRGKIMLRDDSATNFSRKMFEKFILPYDQRLLDEFGGAVHFCGKGDHLINSLSTLRGLHAVNVSQPELNDMEKIYQHTVDKGIFLIGLNREAAEKAVAAGRNLRGKVHCY